MPAKVKTLIREVDLIDIGTDLVYVHKVLGLFTLHLGPVKKPLIEFNSIHVRIGK